MYQQKEIVALWTVAGACLAMIACDAGGTGVVASSDAGTSVDGTGGGWQSADSGIDVSRGDVTTTEASGTGGAVVVESSGCPFFTPDDPWRQDVSTRPADAAQTARLQALLGAEKWAVHTQFDPLESPGIPITIVPPDQPLVDVKNGSTPMHDDPGPYPFPGRGVAHLEGTNDITDCEGSCRLIVVQRGTCLLFEGWSCIFEPSAGWQCLAASRWDLKVSSYNQRKGRPLFADTGGFPIYAGLARYEEIATGEIKHALRASIECPTAGFVAPATHDVEIASPTCTSNTNALPLGQRLRLKASYDESQLRPQARIIVRALKTYGLIVADTYGAFDTYLEDHPGWRSDLDDLREIPASAFEAIGP